MFLSNLLDYYFLLCCTAAKINILFKTEKERMQEFTVTPTKFSSFYYSIQSVRGSF
jgi:hypothetical protein